MDDLCYIAIQSLRANQEIDAEIHKGQIVGRVWGCNDPLAKQTILERIGNTFSGVHKMAFTAPERDLTERGNMHSTQRFLLFSIKAVLNNYQRMYLSMVQLIQNHKLVQVYFSLHLA